MVDYIKPEQREIDELARNIEKLRVYYDQYFMGIEKTEPVQLRQLIERAIRNSNLHEARQTRLRFRFNSLVNRFRTYAVYWDRILRELEEGKFKREKFRRTLTAVKKEIPEGKYEIKERRVIESSVETPLPETGMEAKKTTQFVKAPGGAAAEPSQEIRDLFDVYIRMKKENKEDTANITFEAFRNSIDKKRMQQMEKLGCEGVNFRVDIKEGRVVIVASSVKRQ